MSTLRVRWLSQFLTRARTSSFFRAARVVRGGTHRAPDTPQRLRADSDDLDTVMADALTDEETAYLQHP